MLQRLVRMFANNIDQEPEKRCIRKKLKPKKEPSRIVIEDLQSTSIVEQVKEIEEEGEEAHINFLEHEGDLQRQSKFNKPKK